MLASGFFSSLGLKIPQGHNPKDHPLPGCKRPRRSLRQPRQLCGAVSCGYGLGDLRPQIFSEAGRSLRNGPGFGVWGLGAGGLEVRPGLSGFLVAGLGRRASGLGGLLGLELQGRKTTKEEEEEEEHRLPLPFLIPLPLLLTPTATTTMTATTTTTTATRCCYCYYCYDDNDDYHHRRRGCCCCTAFSAHGQLTQFQVSSTG